MRSAKTPPGRSSANPPPRPSTSTQPPSESVTPSISHGEDHARRILHELPVPDAQGFDITHEHLHTAYQWIGLTLTTPPTTSPGTSDTLSTPDPQPSAPATDTATQYAIALLLTGSLAATPPLPTVRPS